MRLMITIIFSLLGMSSFSQIIPNFQPINGKNNYRDSLAFSKYKNTSGDSVLTTDAAGKVKLVKASSLISDYWKITGNDDTDGGSTNFIGTTNPVDLLVKTNNNRVANFGQNDNVSFGASTASGTESTSGGWSSTVASGMSSTAFGRSIASNNQASAMGGSIASGQYSSAFGSSIASGDASFTGGAGRATGSYSVAFGNTISKSFAGTTIGYFNDTTNAASGTAINAANRVFQIGIGTSSSLTANAMTVLQNGNTGIGTLIPTATLHTNGTVRFQNISTGAGIYAARLDANGNLTKSVAPLTGNNCFDIVINGGADSTGATDASGIFQSAIDAGYKCITIPTGTFLLSSTVLMKDSVTIQGFGNSSKIKITGNFPAFKCRDLGAYSRGTYTLVTTPDSKVDHGTASYVIGSGGGGYNTKFLNFSIFGTRGATTAQSGIYLDTVNTVIVDKVTALNLGGFMTVVNRNGVAGEFVGGFLMMENATRGVRVTNCYAQYCYGGVALDTTAEYNIVTNNTFVNNIYGVFDRGANNIISNNNLSTNFYGLRALFHSSNNGHSTVNGNTINHCNHSIWLTGLTFGYYMADNDIYSEDSIVIENCTRVEISGGYIFIQNPKPFVMNNNTSLALKDVGKLIGTAPVYSVTGNPPTVTQTGKVDNAISLIDVVNNKQVDIGQTNGLFSVTLNGALTSIKAGIGTLTPDSSLHVIGGFHNTGGVRLQGIPVGALTDSALTWDASTQSVRYKAFPTASTASPAGNYGNLQINRNGVFATPASDTLNYNTTNGLTLLNKFGIGTATTTAQLTINNAASMASMDMFGNDGALIRIGYTSGDNDHAKIFRPFGGALVLRNQSGGVTISAGVNDSGTDGARISPTTFNFGIGTNSPNSKLQVAGSVSAAYIAKTATYSIGDNDYTIDCTSGTFTVTLPTAAGITGRIYNISNSGAGVITIATTSSQTFTNVATTPTTLTLSALGSFTVQSTGSAWIVL